MKKNGIENQDYIGTILWFRDDLGYGFIECPNFDKAIFCHYSKIMTHEGYFKTLSRGQVVVFEATLSTRGLMALNVRENKVIKANAVDVS